MTIDDFTIKLTGRWNEMDREDIEFICDELKSYSEEHYESIYVEFRKNYKYKTPPGVANIVGAIKSLGLKKSFSHGDTSEYAYKCVSCGQMYAGRISWMDAPACPKCFSKESSVVESPQRTDVVTVQTMCLIGWGDHTGLPEEPKKFSHCPVWEKEIHSMGPLCDIFYYGRGEECRTCSCRKCCSSARREKEELENGVKGKDSVSGIVKGAFSRIVAE